MVLFFFFFDKLTLTFCLENDKRHRINFKYLYKRLIFLKGYNEMKMIFFNWIKNNEMEEKKRNRLKKKGLSDPHTSLFFDIYS